MQEPAPSPDAPGPSDAPVSSGAPVRPGAHGPRRRAHTGLGLLLAGPLLGLLLVGVLSLATINEVRVGGPQDDRVTQAHALVADTTLPSQDLTALRGTLLLLPPDLGTEDEATLRADVERAEARYREGHAYWDNHLSDPALRDSLLVEAHEPVASLFRLVHERLWPALDRGQRLQATDIVHDQLLPLLDQHETAMASVSKQAADVLAATSARTDDAITLRTRLFVAVLGAVMVLVAIAAVAALRLTRRDERDEQDDQLVGVDTAPDAVSAATAASADRTRPRADGDDGDVDEDPVPTLAEALMLRPIGDPSDTSDLPADVPTAAPTTELTH